MSRTRPIGRRRFLEAAVAGTAVAAVGEPQARPGRSGKTDLKHQPNLVFVFADQWRAQATGYAGDPNAETPTLDRLEKESVNFTHAVSGCPVCSPYRASLITGQYWLTHRHILNDLYLPSEEVSIAEAFNTAGYDTAYIGKWHLDGHGRSSFIPRERRQGFRFWKVMECTHDYNHSYYYGDENYRLMWDGCDAIAQTCEAKRYLYEHDPNKPFALFLSWGPPHAPYQTAPEKYRKRYDPEKIVLRDNVPKDLEATARQELAGYYAHIAALDDCLDELLLTLEDCGLKDDTVFVFTSDHGDMLRSQGEVKKQRPWDESIRVPFLLRYPSGLGTGGKHLDTLINTPDIMPTLLGLCGVEIPKSVEGTDFSKALLDGKTPEREDALILCPAPFGQWTRKMGGREFRGVRTKRYTYCRDLDGPWLLYDNEADPYQMKNLVGCSRYSDLQANLEDRLNRWLKRTHDDFMTAEYYIAEWNYQVDENGTVRYES